MSADAAAPTWCRLALCGATLLAAACTQRGGKPTEQPKVTFAAQGEAAPTYRSEPSDEPALRGPSGEQLGRAVEQAAAARKLTLTPDGRLGQLADWVVHNLDASGSAPPYAVTELWARHLGLPEPTPHLVVLIGPDTSLAERAAAELEPLLAQQRYTHFGAAAFPLKGGSGAVAVVVLSWRWLTLQPVPRVVAPGSTIVLSGRIDPDLHDPELVLTEPDGTSRRLGAQPGRDFRAEVGVQQGELRVELLARSALGVAVVANFPVYAGVAPPTEVTVAPVSGGAPIDEHDVVARLLELTNADRTRAGIAPVALDSELSAIAVAHSRDMHDHGFVGHTSPTTGSAKDRVARAGVRTTVVLENIGRGYGPDEVHRGLMDSPGHRANVLSPDVTHVGIGVVRESDDPHAAYLVTEVYVLRASEIDVDDAPDQLLDMINAERVRRGIQPLIVDDGMAALAHDTAKAFFADQRSGRQQLVEALNRRAASKPSAKYRRLTSMLTVVASLSEAREIEGLLDPQLRAVGFGVAQGTRADTVPNAIVIVALVAY